MPVPSLLVLSLFLAPGPLQAESAPRATEPVLDLRLVDLDGRVHRIGSAPEPGPFALVFLDAGCPVARKYAERLGELAREAAELGVGFHGVLSDPALGLAAAREFRDAHALAFPVLHDAVGELAARLAPTAVPEAFVFDAGGSLAYRGRIDDRFVEPGRPRAAVTSEELRGALAAVAAGSAPAVAYAPPVGCVFEAWDHADVAAEITWGRDVAPLLRANCVDCHRTGDVGPFPLVEYEDARRRARTIADVVARRAMPPWHAEPGHGDFRDTRVLSEREIAVLAAWAEAGAPRGDATDELPAPELPDGRWRLGEPDLLVAMSAEYSVPASGDDVYRVFVVPNELLEERDVVAVDFRPGAPSVVHHCIVYYDDTGRARTLDAGDPEPGFALFEEDTGFLEENAIAGWAPGTQPYRYPRGLGMALPAGGDFVLEVHYHPNGAPAADRSALALYFADEPVERQVVGLVIGTEEIDIPAGEARYRRSVWMNVPHDMEVIDVTPHMHYLGKDVDVVATLPDGDELPLLRVPRWDFRWQDTYVYRRPVRLPRGTRIDARFTFDNSAENPSNPSRPPIRVAEGWRTTDEMCLLYLTVVPREAEHARRIEYAALASFFRPPE